jgi:hypothetical protein
MTAMWLALLMSAAPSSEGARAAPANPAAVSTDPSQAAPQRQGRELSDAFHATMRRWARATDAQASKAAIEFLALYHEFQDDKQLPPSSREQLRIRVRYRLIQLSDQISRRVAREKRLAQNQPGDQAPKTLQPPEDKPAELAQMGMMGGMAGRPGFGGGAMGGMPAGAPGAQNNQPDDYGQDLVDLIQKTIAPSTWDVNGGAGTIYYWNPGHAMVIMQTDDVHDQIADVLLQLQNAGR